MKSTGNNSQVGIFPSAVKNVKPPTFEISGTPDTLPETPHDDINSPSSPSKGSLDADSSVNHHLSIAHHSESIFSPLDVSITFKKKISHDDKSLPIEKPTLETDKDTLENDAYSKSSSKRKLLDAMRSIARSPIKGKNYEDDLSFDDRSDIFSTFRTLAHGDEEEDNSIISYGSKKDLFFSLRSFAECPAHGQSSVTSIESKKDFLMSLRSYARENANTQKSTEETNIQSKACLLSNLRNIAGEKSLHQDSNVSFDSKASMISSLRSISGNNIERTKNTETSKSKAAMISSLRHIANENTSKVSIESKRGVLSSLRNIASTKVVKNKDDTNNDTSVALANKSEEQNECSSESEIHIIESSLPSADINAFEGQSDINNIESILVNPAGSSVPSAELAKNEDENSNIASAELVANVEDSNICSSESESHIESSLPTDVDEFDLLVKKLKNSIRFSTDNESHIETSIPTDDIDKWTLSNSEDGLEKVDYNIGCSSESESHIIESSLPSADTNTFEGQSDINDIESILVNPLGSSVPSAELAKNEDENSNIASTELVANVEDSNICSSESESHIIESSLPSDDINAFEGQSDINNIESILVNPLGSSVPSAKLLKNEDENSNIASTELVANVEDSNICSSESESHIESALPTDVDASALSSDFDLLLKKIEDSIGFRTESDSYVESSLPADINEDVVEKVDDINSCKSSELIQLVKKVEDSNSCRSESEFHIMESSVPADIPHKNLDRNNINKTFDINTEKLSSPGFIASTDLVENDIDLISSQSNIVGGINKYPSEIDSTSILENLADGPFPLYRRESGVLFLQRYNSGDGCGLTDSIQSNESIQPSNATACRLGLSQQTNPSSNTSSILDNNPRLEKETNNLRWATTSSKSPNDKILLSSHNSFTSMTSVASSTCESSTTVRASHLKHCKQSEIRLDQSFMKRSFAEKSINIHQNKKSFDPFSDLSRLMLDRIDSNTEKCIELPSKSDIQRKAYIQTSNKSKDLLVTQNRENLISKTPSQQVKLNASNIPDISVLKDDSFSRDNCETNKSINSCKRTVVDPERSSVIIGKSRDYKVAALGADSNDKNETLYHDKTPRAKNLSFLDIGNSYDSNSITHVNTNRSVVDRMTKKSLQRRSLEKRRSEYNRRKTEYEREFEQEVKRYMEQESHKESQLKNDEKIAEFVKKRKASQPLKRAVDMFIQDHSIIDVIASDNLSDISSLGTNSITSGFSLSKQAIISQYPHLSTQLRSKHGHKPTRSTQEQIQVPLDKYEQSQDKFDVQDNHDGGFPITEKHGKLLVPSTNDRNKPNINIQSAKPDIQRKERSVPNIDRVIEQFQVMRKEIDLKGRKNIQSDCNLDLNENKRLYDEFKSIEEQQSNRRMDLMWSKMNGSQQDKPQSSQDDCCVSFNEKEVKREAIQSLLCNENISVKKARKQETKTHTLSDSINQTNEEKQLKKKKRKKKILNKFKDMMRRKNKSKGGKSADDSSILGISSIDSYIQDEMKKRENKLKLFLKRRKRKKDVQNINNKNVEIKKYVDKSNISEDLCQSMMNIGVNRLNDSDSSFSGSEISDDNHEILINGFSYSLQSII